MLITGAPPVFSAGYDIGSIPEPSFERDAEALVAHPFHAAMEQLAAHPWPTVAAINGHCLGGGLELAITCDLRICAAGAKLGMPPAKLGLIYGHTGLRKFLDVVGLARTKELFLTGRNLDATRAAEIGLVHEVVGDEELEGAAVELAAEVAANAPLSMRGQQAGDRDAERESGAQRAAGARAGRAARVVLRLRGLPRGNPRLRREAQAAVDRALSAAPMAPRRAGRADPVMAGLIERLGRPQRRAATPRACRSPTPTARCCGRSSASSSRQGGADDLRAGAGRSSAAAPRRPRSCWRSTRRTCAAPASPAARSPTSATSPQHVIDGELELDRLDELSDEEVIEEIVAVRGLGRWSAEMFLIFHLERPDVISAGDLGLRRAMQIEYGLEEMPGEQQFLEIAERWRPHRSLASIYLWESLAGDVTVGGT